MLLDKRESAWQEPAGVGTLVPVAERGPRSPVGAANDDDIDDEQLDDDLDDDDLDDDLDADFEEDDDPPGERPSAG